VTNTINKQSLKKQVGAVLVMSMVFLIVLTLLGLSSMSNSTLELKIASSSQQRDVAFQGAQSVIDFVMTAPFPPNPMNFLMPINDSIFDYLADNPVAACNSGASCPPGLAFVQWSANTTVGYAGCGKGTGSSLEEGKAFYYRNFDITAQGQTNTGSSYSTQSQGVKFPAAGC